MALEDRNLAVGTKLVARYKGKEYTAEVVEAQEGLRYRLEDGKEFKSLSSAGSAVMGGSACNGWRFWSLEGGEEAKPKKAAKKAAKASGNPGFKRLDDGRYFCDSCMEAFDAPKDVTPVGCPKGHRPEDFKES
jgi:hypothetical protein